MSKRISRCLINKFTPLNRIASQHIDELMDCCEEKNILDGGVVLRMKDNDQFKSFLIRGKIEVRRSFHERVYLNSESEQCKKPLNELLSSAGVIRAKSPCSLLRIDVEKMEQLLAWSDLNNYQIAHIDDGEYSLDCNIIDDNFEDDWSELFLQSALAANLNTQAISNLFKDIEDIDVKAGETIFSQYTDGDFFYIIKQGEARIHLDAFGPQKGKCVDLQVGSYFGDEALVAETPRNASVVMKTEGVLGRLDKESFEAIVKTALVNPISIQQLVKLNTNEYQCIDVRSSAERRFAGLDKSKGFPITHLRQHLSQLEKQTTYIVGPECDRRSELGAYLLRQAGFNAYCLSA